MMHHEIKSVIRLAVCLLGAFFFLREEKSALAQTTTTSGTDFWMGFMYDFQPGETGTVYKLSISSVTGASGTVSVPLNTFSTPFTVGANATTVITIPYAQVQNETSESVQPKGVHIVSNNPVSVFSSVYSIVRTEAALVIPTPLLGTEYYVLSYPGYWYGQSNFEIVATQNATSIQITPSSQTMGNKSAGTPFTITLNAGEVYLVRAKQGFTNAGQDDMTGSRILGTDPCKPFAVFSGAAEVYLPTTCGTADPLYEELMPVSSWGTEYVVPPFFSSTGSICRIVASQNATSVSIDGGAPISLNAGQFNEQTFNGSAHCITANKPIEVAQLMQGNMCSGATPNKGDPDMLVLNSNNQLTKQVVFTPYNNFMAARYVNVVMKTAYTGQLRLDGVAAGTFSASPCTGYSYATIPVTNAFHTLFADSGFVAYLYGYGSGDESYSLPLGYSGKVATSASAAIASSTTICSGSSATLTASGGGNYSWSTGATTTTITVSPTATTTYTLNVTSGCGTATATATVTVSNSLTATISGNTTICPGANATLTASGGGNYSWSTGATTSSITVSPTATTSYTTFVTAGSCSATATGTVTVGNSTTASVSGSTTVCPGSSATLSASGGGTYSWNTGGTSSSITVSPTATTTYTVVAAAGSCSATATGTVTVGNNTTASVSGNTTICPGGNAILTASGGGNYSWSTGASTSSITISPTTTTSYTAFVTVGTCSATATGTVTVNNSITAAVSGNTSVCAGNSTTLTASGGSSFSWSTGGTSTAIVVAPTTGTTYSVWVSSGTCKDSTSILVNVNPNPTILYNSATICAGSSATLSASGGNSYLWNPGGSTSASIVVNPSSTTNYTITATSAAGCTSTAGTSVIVNLPPTASISSSSTICIGDAATLIASGGGTYSWNTGATSPGISPSPSTTTSYTVIVTNTSGCTATATASVVVASPPIATIAGNNTICAGNSTVLTASGGGNYLWNTLQTSAAITVSPPATTNYSVVVSIGSCTATASYTVLVQPVPVATAQNSVVINIGDNTTLTATGGGTYSWAPATGLSCSDCSNPVASPDITTDYCVYVTDAAGCTDSACVRVTVELNCKPIYLPNAFSPNSDNENDILYVYGNCIKEMKLAIYNRWGEKVYEGTDPKEGWNGTYQGKAENSAVFAYYLDYTLINGSSGSKKGNVSLVR